MRDALTEHVLTFPVLGIPTRFETNSSTVAQLINETFGDWQALYERPELIEPVSATVRILVHDETYPDRSYRYRSLADDRVLISSGDSVAICDPLRRESVAFVSVAHVADRALFRYAVLEAMTNAVLTLLDRQPLHAAGVVGNGVAVLLAGPSGIGKSTLVYALARAGFELLTDDVVFLQLKPRLRAWGQPRFLNLSESSSRFFPELERCSATLTANGKHKIAVDARARGFTTGLPVAERALLCVLQRHVGPPAIEPISAAELETALLSGGESGFDLFAETIRPAIHALAEEGGWRIRLGDHPQDVVPLIEQLVSS